MENNLGRMGYLVRVETSLGYELTGFYAPADKPNAPTILYTHGLSGSFDTNFNYNLLSNTSASRFNILLSTSSGTGNISTTRRGDPRLYRLTGSAFEIFEDCVPDLGAWMDFASEQGSGPVILWGHSLGSSKVTYYLASTNDERVAGAVLASPSDVTGGFMDNVGAKNVPGFLQQARDLVAEGQASTLMPEACTIGLLKQKISAGTMVDRFENGKEADCFDFYGRQSSTAFKALAKVTKPLMIIYCETGELVGPNGVEVAVETLRQKAENSPRVDALIVGGNHWYMGHEDKAMNALLEWSMETVGFDMAG